MKKAIRFSLDVCLLSWLAFLVYYAYTGYNINTSSIGYTLFAAAYMFLPMITALLLQRKDHEPLKSTGLLQFRLSWTWLAALLLPVVMCAITTLISGLMPGVHFHYGPEQIISMQDKLDETAIATMKEQLSSVSPALMIISTLTSAIFAGCTINAVAAFGEEYGWRNYLASALRGSSFWKAALFIGTVWGIWHFPLILCGHNYPQHPVVGVFMMVAFCIALGIVELYLVRKAGSVYPAAIFHGTINASTNTTLMLVQGGNDLTIGATGIAGFITLSIIIAALRAYDKYITKDNIFSSVL